MFKKLFIIENLKAKEVKMMKKMMFILGICALSLVMVTSANADPVAGLFESAGVQTLLSDNSADILLNVDGSVSAGGTPTITVGDILVTILGITTIGPTTIGSGTIYNEVTAVSAVKIATSADVDVGPPGPDDSFGTQNINLFQYTEMPLSAVDTAWFDWSTGIIDDNGPAAGGNIYTFTPIAGTSNDGMLSGAVFEDAAKNYNRDSSIQAGITSATDGSVRLLLGIVLANSDFLSVRAPFDMGGFLTVPLATSIDNSNISLDNTIIAQSWPGLSFNTNITGGNGGFSSRTAGSSWPVFDNLDFTVMVEPPKCGDGIVGNTPGETCDPPGSNAGQPNECRANCTFCGDGNLDAGEQCDDGNNIDGDGCSSTCGGECGDGIVGNTQGETCDTNPQPPVNGSPSDLRPCRQPGTDAQCTYCGDGIVNNGEQCDDGNSTNGDGCDNTCTIELFGGCRMTGGNNTVAPDGSVYVVPGDSVVTNVVKSGKKTTTFKYTVGGQIGAPQAGCCTPGVDCAPGNGGYGEWEHSHHENGVLKFSFHAGTNSAPADSYIQCITCSDPFWCTQARCAPFKQIFWEGTGIFQNPNKNNDGHFSLGGCNIDPVAGKTNSLHYYQAHVGDFGEPGNTGKQKSYDPAVCSWHSGGVEAGNTVLIQPQPPQADPKFPQFFDKGGMLCEDCPDWYEIEIHCTDNPNSPIIYKAAGYLTGGNHQIHPAVGEQCPFGK